jgi:hypothetical protein
MEHLTKILEGIFQFLITADYNREENPCTLVIFAVSSFGRLCPSELLSRGIFRPGSGCYGKQNQVLSIKFLTLFQLLGS